MRDLTGMDELDHAFPAPYAAVKDAIREVQQTVWGYDQQIKAIEAGQLTAPTSRPRGRDS